MKGTIYLLLIFTALLSGCTNDQDEPLAQVAPQDTTLYFNTGKVVHPISTNAIFPWLNATERKQAISDIFRVFPSNKAYVRTGNNSERRIIAYGFQSFEKEKTTKYAFTKEQLQQMGLPRDIYVVTKHRVKQIFACEIGSIITPYPQYENSKYKENMGILQYDRLTKRDIIGFRTNLLGKGATTSKTFEGYTELLYIHSDVWGRRGYRQWWPCAPEDLVWIYSEKPDNFNWDL